MPPPLLHTFHDIQGNNQHPLFFVYLYVTFIIKNINVFCLGLFICLKNMMIPSNEFRDYWTNDYRNLSCPYFEPNNSDHFEQIWESNLYGYEVKLLSHLCLNGTLSEIGLDEWNKRCFPTHMENKGLRMSTGIWSLFNFVVGFLGNLLTLMAIPYAKWKHRYDFHKTFWTTDIWILNLALCDLIFSIFCAPQYFIPYLGFRYPQGYGWDTICKVSFILTKLTYTNDWLLLSIIAITRAIKVKKPFKWRDFCDKKICVYVCLVSPWLFQVINMLPVFLQPSTDFGYNCLMGKCDFIPTGEHPLPVFERHPWIVEKLPFLTTFLIPCALITVSYLVIWRHIRNTQKNKYKYSSVKVDENANGKLSKREVKFIWTIFIICICFLACSAPVAIVADVLGITNGNPFLVVISIMWCQYGINFFIYACRSKQYRAAYWDLLVLICPCLIKYRENMNISRGKSG